MVDENCLFCKIVAGDIPSDALFEDDLVKAFTDIAPVAPTHLLIIPRRHIDSAADLAEGDAQLLGRIFDVSASLARDAGVDKTGYRVVSNVGADGGQSVDHLHFHLLGGRSFAWPPG